MTTTIFRIYYIFCQVELSCMSSHLDFPNSTDLTANNRQSFQTPFYIFFAAYLIFYFRTNTAIYSAEL